MGNKIVEEYIEAAISYGIYIEAGNSKKANVNADKMHEIRMKAKKAENYERYFFPLLNHENDYVKLYTAYFLLQSFPENSSVIIEKLSKKKGLLGFEAKMTLEEWNKENLNFDW